MRAIKKPIEVSVWKLDSRAYMYEPMAPNVPRWVWDSIRDGKLRWDKNNSDWAIWSLEGIVVAHDNDYLIRGVMGEIYPCREDIFEDTYDIVSP